MIEISNISKSYGQLTVLHDISLSINDHEIICIMGPSGAGKTTLIQIAGTLDKPDSGTVLYDGVDVTRLGDKKLSRFRNSNIGFVFQFHQLMAEFTAQENVALPAMIGGMSRHKSMTRAAELLDMLGLSDRATHKPAELSGGERQRTAIARALINNPKVIYADEPTGSLDSHNRDEITTAIRRLRDELGQTFVLVTHDPVITSIADRTVHVADGHIQQGDEPLSQTRQAETLRPENQSILPE